MRRLAALAGVCALAGCGGDPASQLNGLWRVEPASVSASRLATGQEANPTWSALKTKLGKVTVTFDSAKHSVQAVGFGKTSTGTWKLLGTQIEIEGSSEWPTLTFDEKSSRVHATMQQDGDTLEFDLVKG
jgi:hypothetical protein